MTRLRIAVVGAGHLGSAHARILARSPAFDLVAIVDPDAARRAALSAELGVPAESSVDALSGRIQAAVVASPTTTHVEVANSLLDQGVHLLIEKPLAADTTAARELTDSARKRGLVLQVGHVERFNPAFVAAAPRLRQPKFIEATRAGGCTFRSTDIGVVLDLMIHDIDLVLALVRAPVEQVEALGLSVLGGHEDVAHARLTFADGCVATLNAARVSYAPQRWMRVWSPLGFASLDFAARTACVVTPSEALVRREIEPTRLPGRERDAFRESLFEQHLRLTDLEVEPRDQLTAELEDFAASIQQGRSPRVTGEAASDAVEVAQRILAAIDEHAWDATATGRRGPFAQPAPQVIPAPHWPLSPAHREQRRVG